MKKSKYNRVIILALVIVALVLTVVNNFTSATIVLYILYDLALIVVMALNKVKVSWEALLIPISSLSALWKYYVMDDKMQMITMISLLVGCLFGFLVSRQEDTKYKIIAFIFAFFFCTLGQVNLLNDFADHEDVTEVTYTVAAIDERTGFGSSGSVYLNDGKSTNEEDLMKVPVKEEELKNYHVDDQFVLPIHNGGIGIRFMIKEELEAGLKK